MDLYDGNIKPCDLCPKQIQLVTDTYAYIEYNGMKGLKPSASLKIRICIECSKEFFGFGPVE